MKGENSTASDSTISTLTYHVTALEITIYFNREGDHDHNGLMFALTENVPILKYIRALGRVGVPSGAGDRTGQGDDPETYYIQAKSRAEEIGVELPSTPEEARQPHPLIRPLVLRSRVGDRVEVELQNEIRGRYVGIHLVGDGYEVTKSDGSQVGQNPASLTAPGSRHTYVWECLHHEGVFPFHDGGNYSGGEDGTNVHGLFGSLVVEPKGAVWRDPVSGRRSVDANGGFQEIDGLYMDILPQGNAQMAHAPASTTTLDNHVWPDPCPYPKFDEKAHREFVIVFHDEPEFLPPHGHLEESPCAEEEGTRGDQHGGNHGGHGDVLPIMPISYRSEPMVNRERTLWRLLREGHVLKHPVLNEEQHHSSWMFGDPVTPILKAYIGDPVRIRLVHAGVKETHVFHLHLYEWHAVPQDKNSPRIDAISFSPQTGHTIEPVWGAGNRHQVAGDVIWHCHLYPHFHEGMWGMFRTFETLQDGEDGDFLQSSDPVYAGRRIGRYPDGTRIERLLPLPDRDPPPRPTTTRPGYPLYVAGEVRQKSPRPPWPSPTVMPSDFDYRPVPTDLERNAFNPQPVPGEMFTRNPVAKQQEQQWRECPEFNQNSGKVVDRDVVVTRTTIVYNRHGWHDPGGHLYYLAAEGHPDTRPGPKEPLFFRAQHGQILNLTLRNDLPRQMRGTAFDVPFPPCPELPWEGECTMHVHMVKFDPVCADGASVGWNYISGPRIGKKMVYRWWADQEFGTIFFHDHLFANLRQKHGLFGALLVEPIGSEFYDNFSNRRIVSGLQARIRVTARSQGNPPCPPVEPTTHWFREFCIAIGDFIPMFDRVHTPLNPPQHPGGHGDQGIMGLNYRNEPIRERGGDPAYWFSSYHHPDPDTTLFATYEGDPIWLRMLQGSHEEQHSFQIHGLRWRRFRANEDSTIRNQQTFGIAEAFTFKSLEPPGAGDHLYKLSGADDLWLGCWGLIRTFGKNELVAASESPLALGEASLASSGTGVAAQTDVPPGAKVRQFHIVAESKRLVYRNPDLVDPFGLVYRLVSVTDPSGKTYDVADRHDPEPLVLRCREGEWVKVTLENRLPHHLMPEPFAPTVPLEERDPRTFRPERPVSSHVSLHADLLRYDVRRDDGANVGRNPEQTVPPGGSLTYTWYAAQPSSPSTTSNAGDPLGSLLLQDMADFRNHRHHGLVGALIVESDDATPYTVAEGATTAAPGALEAWYGSRVTVVRSRPTRPQEGRYEEIVLLLQDGLRLYLNGNLHFSIPDAPPGVGEDQTDREDQGQKGFNYRTELTGTNTNPLDGTPAALRNWLANPAPATPVWYVPVGETVRFHLVGACDKPRNHSFTIHAVTWPEWRFLSPEEQPRVASEGAISCGTVRVFEFTPKYPGDHAYRSGVLKWAVSEGLWGILRVVGDSDVSED